MVAPQNNHFIIRSYQNGDEKAINDMFNEVFGQQRDIAHWYWKYRDNPYGSHLISLAISDQGMLAAHYGGYPVMLCFSPANNHKAREIVTCHLGDKMTRKQFRGVGHGKSSLLAKTFFHFKEAHGAIIPFGYGFGTHHSLRLGLLFLNYADIEAVSYRTLDVSALRRIKASIVKKVIFGLSVDEVSVADRSLTDFFHRVAPHYKYLAKRDHTYLNWRYCGRPDRRYLFLAIRRRGKLAGWSVFYREGNKIIWGDALFTPRDIVSVKCMLQHLLALPYAEGIECIESWFPPQPLWWDDILRSLNFISGAEPSNLHLTSPVFSDPAAPEMLSKYFYYTMGDSDLF